MVEPGSELDLSKEAIGAQRCGEIRVKNLQGDDSIVLAILSEVYRRHAAAAQLPIYRI
jgi:hypothetical protein